MMSEPFSLIQSLRSLGFRTSDAAMLALLKHAVTSRMSLVKGMEQLVEMEKREREGRNLTARAKAACLGTVPAVDKFDWSHADSIDQGLFEQLLSLRFVMAGENVLLRGPSGVGKTTLAQHLGAAALNEGKSVRMVSLTCALADLVKQESIPATERRLRTYIRPELLILDELGYIPCDSRAADMLFNIIAGRHEKKSTIITTNLPYKKWGDALGDAGCVTALVDRFTQHCHTLDIVGNSWRQKERKKREEAQKNKDASS
jgi:DNA replication protein DnaC